MSKRKVHNKTKTSQKTQICNQMDRWVQNEKIGKQNGVMFFDYFRRINAQENVNVAWSCVYLLVVCNVNWKRRIQKLSETNLNTKEWHQN